MGRAAAALLLWNALSLSGASAGEFPTAEQTRREFQAVCERLREGSDPYFGRRQIVELEKRLGSGSVLQAVQTRGQFAHELLRVGENSRALKQLELARAQLRSNRFEGAELDRAGFIDLALIWTTAMAHLRTAEVTNCVELHGPTSCILRQDGPNRHESPAAARRAGDLFQTIVAGHPQAIQARWLLLLSRVFSGEYPERVPDDLRLAVPASTTDPSVSGWRDIAPLLGLDVFDLAGGALIEDFDGDGLLDIVSSTWTVCEPMKAFRNDGRGGFEDKTAEWGLAGQLGGSNLVHGDYDNDGWPDILVLRGGWLGSAGRIRNTLLRNELGRATGTFVDVTRFAGLELPAYPSQAGAWADYDGDGDLDLYIGNEASGSDADPLKLAGLGSNPYPSQLFRNRGDGTFVDVAREAGVEDLRYTKAVAWGDYDNDGDPDLFVSNLGPNRFYRNNGDGSFTDIAPELGVTRPDGGSFPTWFFDYDNDGDLDLFVADYNGPLENISSSYLGLPTQGGHPLLYRNDGGRFREVSEEVGLTRPSLPMGANYGDLDNDGWLDFYLGTGSPKFESVMPNIMYRNDRGRRFTDVTFEGGFGHLQKGHGIAFGDLDNDGDQDLFEQMGGAFPADGFYNALYENPGGDNRWVVLRLEGRQANRSAIGGRIEVRVRSGEAVRSIHVQVGSGGSFGGSSLQQEIGLGRADAIEDVTILWPGSGNKQVFEGPELDGFYRAIEGAAELITVRPPVFSLGGTASRRPEP